MKPLFKGIIFAVIFAYTISVSAATNDEKMSLSVLKIKTYEKEQIRGNYTYIQWGSAVFLGKNRIITNAHVILDSDGKHPTGLYEVCSSVKNKKDPVCFATAKLISYDTITDLAVLEVTQPYNASSGVEFSKKTMSTGNSVIVYGYPSIGGESITRTEGKIGGQADQSYKFDGTIDHGNSGGGAFDSDGKLIGIPYSVKSDNGMIGYIIPASEVQKFLNGKTDAIEKYSITPEKSFVDYIKSIESFYLNGNLIKTPRFELSNALKAGFTVKGANISTDGTVIDLRLLDKNSRVGIMVSCDMSSSVGSKSALEISKDSLNNSYKIPGVTITDRYLDTKNTIYFQKGTATKENKGEKVIVGTAWYTTVPNCSSSVVANDGDKKDKSSYEKALSLIQSIKFINPIVSPKEYNTPFFVAKNLPMKNIFIGESTQLDTFKILPYVSFAFEKEYNATAYLDIYKFDDRDGYMNFGYSEGNNYTGTDYSFGTFYNRYRTTGNSDVQDYEMTSRNGKKFVITVSNNTNTDVTPIQEKTNVYFFYPFVDSKGVYRAYSFSFDLHSRKGEHVQLIKDFFESLELPGTSPFQK